MSKRPWVWTGKGCTAVSVEELHGELCNHNELYLCDAVLRCSHCCPAVLSVPGLQQPVVQQLAGGSWESRETLLRLFWALFSVCKIMPLKMLVWRACEMERDVTLKHLPKSLQYANFIIVGSVSGDAYTYITTSWPWLCGFRCFIYSVTDSTQGSAINPCCLLDGCQACRVFQVVRNKLDLVESAWHNTNLKANSYSM